MAVGVFDSGLGGLTVLGAISRRLPDLPVVYLGDNKHTPYGVRDADDIFNLTCAGVERLWAEGCDLVILACNTASAACLADARERYDVPVVEVIRPAVRRAIAATRTGEVGVITASIKEVVAEVQSYVPGYRLLNEPQFDEPSVVNGGQHVVSIFVEVEGAGDYLPTYAGNLDIMTAAATKVGEEIAKEIVGVKA